jgi:hypothetical protein
MKRKQGIGGSALTLRASEIGSYLYCRRAWWYQRQGVSEGTTEARESGLAWHRQHGRRILTAAMLRGVGWALILTAAAVAAGAAVAAWLR